MSSALNCPKCHAVAANGARFCAQCGERIELKCSGCGQPTSPGAWFCESCGAPPAAAKGDRRVVTVLFADVSGFTAMSEKLPPAELTRLVNRFFGVLTRPIYALGGVVDKYIGDAIMALFGAPIAHEDDPERAIAAAWEMQIAAKIFADDLEATTGIRLRLRIGLHTGLVIAGAVGGEKKRDYTVLGDTVHLASRMEAGARPGAVLVSEETYRLVSGGWDFVELAPVAVEGRRAAVRAFEPTGPRPASAPAAERPAFVGRATETSQLQWALDAAQAHQPQLVVVSGPAGIGKSRLVRNFVLEVAEPRGVRVLRARAFSYQRQSTFAVLSSLVMAWLGLNERELGMSQLEGALAAAGSAQSERDAELIGFLLGVEGHDASLAALAPEKRRDLATGRLFELLVTPGMPPLVLSLNDLQWADEPSIAWLEGFLLAIATQSEPPPVMVVLQYRSGWKGVATPAELPTLALALAPMGRDDGEHLLRSWLQLEGPIPGEGMRAALLQVLARAEGNPLFVCELMRSLHEAGALSRHREVWRYEPARMPTNLPNTLQAAVISRLDRLSPSARQAIQVAAVLGREFSRSLLTQACQADELAAALGELAEAELVTPRERAGFYGFNQAMLQEVAYQSILLKVRRELHRRVGGLMEEAAAYQSSDQAHVLAYHFRAAEDAPRALKYGFKAGLHAAARFDNQAARQLFAMALELRNQLDAQEPVEPRRERLLTVLGEVETTLGEYREALGHLGRALVGTTDPAALADIHRKLGTIHERMGAYDEAIRVYEAALAGSSDLDEAQRAGLEAAIAYAEYGQGNFERATQRCAKALSRLAGTRSGADRAFAHTVMGLALTRLGRLDEAGAAHAAAMELRQAAGDRLGVGISANNLSQVAYEAGAFDAACAHLETAIAEFEAVGDQSTITIALNNLGMLHMEADRLEEAEASLIRSVALARRIGYASRLALARCNLGEVLSRQERHDEAIALLREGLGALEQLGNREVLTQAHPMLARALIHAGRDREAWDVVTAGLKLNRQGRHDPERGIYYALAGTIYARSGRLEAAISWLGRAVGLLEASANRIELARAWASMAEALAVQQQATHALDAARRALELFDELGARYDRRRLAAWLAKNSLTV